MASTPSLIQDPRGSHGIMARGANVYGAASMAPQGAGRPATNAPLQLRDAIQRRLSGPKMSEIAPGALERRINSGNQPNPWHPQT